MEFFTTNAPGPLYSTLNSCIAAFRSVWVHFGLFRYCTKLGAKRADLVRLMQKFLPQSRIRIFRNECTRSTPLGPKLMFWCVLLCVDAFWIVCYYMMLDTKWAELLQLMQKFVPRSRIRFFRNEQNRTTPLDPKLMFWSAS